MKAMKFTIRELKWSVMGMLSNHLEAAAVELLERSIDVTPYIRRLVSNHHGVLLARNGRTVLGVAIVVAVDSMLEVLAVDKPYRRAGVGSALVEAAYQYMQQNANLRVKAAAAKGISQRNLERFYRRHGFVMGRAPSDIGYYSECMPMYRNLLGETKRPSRKKEQAEKEV